MSYADIGSPMSDTTDSSVESDNERTINDEADFWAEYGHQHPRGDDTYCLYCREEYFVNQYHSSKRMPEHSSHEYDISQAKPHSPFLELPGELRNRVYHYVFGYEKITIRDVNLLESKVDPSRSKYKIRSRFIFVPRGYSISNNPGKNITSQRRQESIGLDVLAVNKQIRQEAGSIFYSRLFNLRCSPETALAFLGERPAWALDHITRVAIVHRTAASDTGRKAWRELCKFIRKQLHLKELHFLCDRPFWRHWYQPDDEIEDWTELSGVDWIRPLIKITGLAKLTVRLSSTYDYFVCCHHNPEPAERHDVLDALLRSKMLEEDGEFVGWRESKKNRRCSICRATRDE